MEKPMEKDEFFKPCLALGHKSPRDQNLYKLKRLKNDIEVLLVQNDDFKNSSCVVGVNVGSYDDPEKYPGMAHFLEHMLFMGTDKYPGENEFDCFLAEHNGSSNAFTTNDKTVYYCNADSRAFTEMVKMFASFFICPMFRQSSVENEMKAVDSEYLNTLNIQEWRVERLRGELDEDGKRGRFSCGNMETLQKKGIVEAMKEFWRNEYSSDLMSVVLCSNETIERMAELAGEFELIPNRKNGKENSLRRFFADVYVGGDWKAMIDLQDIPEVSNRKMEENRSVNKKVVGEVDDKTGNGNTIIDTASKELCKSNALRHIVWMNHISNRNELNISVKLHPLLHMFKYKVFEYIKYELTNETSGSLLSLYKDKDLAFSIDLESTHYVEFSEVTLAIGLTTTGRDKHKEVLDMLCAWLDGMVPQKCVWQWMGRVAAEEFRCRSGEKASEAGLVLCEALMMYPAANLLNNEYVFEKYDAEVITHFVKLLRDYSRWLVILAVAYDPGFDCVEKFYNVKYKIGELYEKKPYAIKRQSCRSTGSETPAFLCGKKPCILYSHDIVNPLGFDIPFHCLTSCSTPSSSCFNSFELASGDNSFFCEDNTGKCLFVFEKQFGLPRTKCFFRLDSQGLKEKFVQNDMFLRLALDAFTEKYCEELMTHQLSVSARLLMHKGFVITFEGLSQHIEAAVTAFFSMLDSLDTRHFSVLRRLAKDDYSDYVAMPPHRRLYPVLCHSLIPGCGTMEQCLLDIEDVCVGDIAPPQGCCLDMTMVGNISQSVVRNIYAIATSCSIASKGHINTMKFISCPDTDKEYSFFTFDLCNNAIGLYFSIVSFDDTSTVCSSNFLLSSSERENILNNKAERENGIIKTAERENGIIKAEDTMETGKLKRYAIGMLFHQIAWNEFFDQLRTKEQLGYVVRCCLRSVENTHFIGFEVQSTKPVDFLEQRIKTYVKWLHHHVAQMDIDQFETHKQSVVDALTDPVFNLDELCDIVVFYDSAFKHDIAAREKLVPIVKILEKADLLQSHIFDHYIKVYSVKKNKA